MYQCCGSGMFIPDGSGFFPFWIPGQNRIFSIPDSRFTSKNVSIWTQKIVSQLSELWSGLFIPDPDPDFLPISDPGVKTAPDPGSETLEGVKGNWEWPLRAPRRGACTWCRIRRWGTASPAPPAPGSPGWTPPSHPRPQLGTGDGSQLHYPDMT